LTLPNTQRTLAVMTGPVICGVDFSEESKRALRWASLLARQLKRPLVAVHAIEPLLVSAARMEYGPDVLHSTLDAELRAFVSRSLGPSRRVQLETGAGAPARVIRGTALARGASLIVLGTQGQGHVGRFWFGSVTTQILRESTLPVLAVPPHAAESGTRFRVAEIIVGTDFGRAANAAAKAARSLSRTFRAKVTVLHALPAVPAPAPWRGAVARTMETALRDARAKLAAAVPDGWTSDVRTGNPARVLVDAAAGRPALIVIGLGGKKAGQRPGTTAYRVLCEADAPVLAVPAR